MNRSALLVAEVPAGLVTVTSTAPVPGGETAVTEVSLVMVTCVADVDPKRTAVAATRLAPVMVTLVPPPAGPEAGLIEVTAGGAATAAEAIAPTPTPDPTRVVSTLKRAHMIRGVGMVTGRVCFARGSRPSTARPRPAGDLDFAARLLTVSGESSSCGTTTTPLRTLLSQVVPARDVAVSQRSCPDHAAKRICSGQQSSAQ